MSQINITQPIRFVDLRDRVCHRFIVDGRHIPETFAGWAAANFDFDAVHRLQLIINLQHISDPKALKLGREQMLNDLAQGAQLFKKLEFIDVLYMVDSKAIPSDFLLDVAPMTFFGWSELFRFPSGQSAPVHNITWLTTTVNVDNPYVQADVMTHTAENYGKKNEFWKMVEKCTTVEKDGEDLLFNLVARYGLFVPRPGCPAATVFPRTWMAGGVWGASPRD